MQSTYYKALMDTMKTISKKSGHKIDLYPAMKDVNVFTKRHGMQRFRQM